MRAFGAAFHSRALTDFLQGMPTGGGSILEGDTNRNTYQNSHAFYVQDSFRVNRQLTLDYGLRWDYFGVIAEKNNLFSNFYPASGRAEPGGHATDCRASTSRTTGISRRAPAWLTTLRAKAPR